MNALSSKYVLYWSVFWSCIFLKRYLTLLASWCFCRPIRKHVWNLAKASWEGQAEKLHRFPFCTLFHCSLQFVTRADPGDSATNSSAYQHSKGTWSYLPKFPCSGLSFFYLFIYLFSPPPRGNSKMLLKHDKFLLHKHCWRLRNRCDFCFRTLGFFHC